MASHTDSNDPTKTDPTKTEDGASPEERGPQDVDGLRRAFRADRRELIRRLGPETIDQASSLYRCPACGHAIVVQESFAGRAEGPVDAYIDHLVRGWWAGRAAYQVSPCPACGTEEGPVVEAGLYGRFLPESGFDWHLELGPDGAVGGWRVDGAARARPLELPKDEGMFRDQTAAFFDLRAGWRWLVDEHRKTGEHVVAEIQPGYLVGVRAGEPGTDPASREDEALGHVFSRHVDYDFDTLEFLGGPAAAEYPFHEELYPEWMGAVADDVESGRLDLFVLAESGRYVEALRDLCDGRDAEVAEVDADGDVIRVVLGPLALTLDLAYPYLRTLHTGRTFSEGVRDFQRPLVDALEGAHGLYELAQARVRDHRVEVVDGTVLRIATPAGEEVGRWDLVELAQRGIASRGGEAAEDFLGLLGYDPEEGVFRDASEALDVCPVCGRPARVNKVLRPKNLLASTDRVMGATLGDHFLYYTRDCPLHSTPVSADSAHDLAALESAYQAGLPTAERALLVASPLELGDGAPDAWVLVGHELGSLVIEPGAVKAALAAGGIELDGRVNLYAFFPDALVVSRRALERADRRQARNAALEALLPRFPSRGWSLDVARAVDLDDAEPVGHFQRVS